MSQKRFRVLSEIDIVPDKFSGAERANIGGYVFAIFPDLPALDGLSAWP